ncbi:MAG: CNNM domain-containing protein [Desulforhopalus sp.]|nr:CNNM domain-containing protein [Desulforhopalus sp.]
MLIEIIALSAISTLILAALCTLCEAVICSITFNQIEILKKSHHATAEYLHSLRTNIDDSTTALLTLKITAIIIGTTVAGIASAKAFGNQYLWLFTVFFSLCILIFSFFISKAIGANYAYKLAPYITYPLLMLVVLLKPFIRLCQSLFRLLPQKTEEKMSTRGQRTIAPFSLDSTDLEANEAKVISNIIDLKHKIVRQVMTPRTVTFSLNEHMTVGNAVAKLNELSSHSRIPIYNREPNNVTGIIMRKDILQAATEGKNKLTLTKFKHPANFVPETARLNRILIEFFDHRQHLFFVVDEYGTMTGIISMEDVLEEIIGREIVDESDNTKDMRELARARNIESRRNLRKTSKNKGLSL